jgi:hypothetical protein
MREQIDLDSLTSEMAGVVRDSVQPTHVSLWLRSWIGRSDWFPGACGKWRDEGLRFEWGSYSSRDEASRALGRDPKVQERRRRILEKWRGEGVGCLSALRGRQIRSVLGTRRVVCIRVAVTEGSLSTGLPYLRGVPE